MERVLNYPFERRSESCLEWLYEVIKSEKYFEFEGMILQEEHCE